MKKLHWILNREKKPSSNFHFNFAVSSTINHITLRYRSSTTLQLQLQSYDFNAVICNYNFIRTGSLKINSAHACDCGRPIDWVLYSMPGSPYRRACIIERGMDKKQKKTKNYPVCMSLRDCQCACYVCLN